VSLIDIFYFTKPIMPRSLQILLRRAYARLKLRACRHLWPIDHGAGQPPIDWTGWPKEKRFALVLTHDVDTAAGHDRCLQLADLEEEFGFRSCFNFVPKDYPVSPDLRRKLTERGFDVGVHGLVHDSKLFRSRKIFEERARLINQYLKEWGAAGFHSPSTLRNLSWIGELDIEYDGSTFDNDPFEPQPDGVRTIFPFWVAADSTEKGYVELPYTLPQDHCLFVILKARDIAIWKEKLDWIAAKGGMALLNSHPDYMNFENKKYGLEEYDSSMYMAFLQYAKSEYGGQYWHALPREIAQFWRRVMVR
jgi:hypothetical protein